MTLIAQKQFVLMFLRRNYNNHLFNSSESRLKRLDNLNNIRIRLVCRSMPYITKSFVNNDGLRPQKGRTVLRS